MSPNPWRDNCAPRASMHSVESCDECYLMMDTSRHNATWGNSGRVLSPMQILNWTRLLQRITLQSTLFVGLLPERMSQQTPSSYFHRFSISRLAAALANPRTLIRLRDHHDSVSKLQKAPGSQVPISEKQAVICNFSICF